MRWLDLLIGGTLILTCLVLAWELLRAWGDDDPNRPAPPLPPRCDCGDRFIREEGDAVYDTTNHTIHQRGLCQPFQEWIDG